MRVELRAAEDGVRLDAALAADERIASRAQAQRLIDAGAVTVNGAVQPKSWRLATGDSIEVTLPATAARTHAATAPYSVAYQDEHLLMVDKPAGIVTHPAPGHSGPTLAEALSGIAAGGPDPERAGIVHRLDRDTSGLLVVARSEPAHAELRRMVRRHELHREYLALVEGHPDADGGTIDAPIGRDRANRTVISTRTDRARGAVTHFEVLERLPRTTLLRVILETGRTHQIRAHLAAIGLPVVADAAYGGGEAGARLGLTRQFLHSSALRFSHPVTREPLDCESKPPADLQSASDAAAREPVFGGPAEN